MYKTKSRDNAIDSWSKKQYELAQHVGVDITAKNHYSSPEASKLVG